MDSKFFASSKTGLKPASAKGTQLYGNKNNKKILKGAGLAAGIAAVVFLILFAVTYFVALRPTLALMSKVNEVKADISEISKSATNRDLVELSANLDKLEMDIAELRAARDENIGWMENFGLTKEYYADSNHFMDAGLQMIEAGREAIKLIEPFADAGGFRISAEQEIEIVDPAQGSGLAEAFSNWIAIMPEIAGDIDVVLNRLTLAGEELNKVDASKYPESFRGTDLRQSIIKAQNTLTLLNDSAPDIKEALNIIPPLLGVGTTEKRYMILMENDKELRATGGFWTYISTFKIANAQLSSDFTSQGTYNIDFALEVIDPYYTFPTVPDAYRNHLKVERMFSRDANISPDFPTSVDQFMLFWDLAGPHSPNVKPVDGVITINTQVLEELLQVTGPVTLNGITYDSETVTLELEKIASLALREQANRKKILGDLMEAMLKNVFESDKNLWPQLVDKGLDLAARKHIKAFMFDPQAQALLEKYNYAGRIADPIPGSGDYAHLVSTNLGGGKTNTWFVNKSVEHSLTREGDRYVRTVAATFTYGDKGPEYDVFKTRYQDWLRLYVPLGSELISIENSDDPAGTGEERNKTYFHGYVTLSPGETKTVTFKYYLPEDVVKGDTYNLYLQKQSGINSEPHTITIGNKSETVELEKDQLYSTKL